MENQLDCGQVKKQEVVKTTLPDRRLAEFVGEDPSKADPDVIFRAARQLLDDASAQDPCLLGRPVFVR